MADENEMNSADDQALADEWAAALGEAGEGGQADIDALLAADAGNSTNRLTMEEFGSVPKNNGPVSLDGPNLDVILDIPVSISMEVGSTEINRVLHHDGWAIRSLYPPGGAFWASSSTSSGPRAST